MTVTQDPIKTVKPVEAAETVETIPNGSGGAAILAAGIGSAAIGIISLIAEMSADFRSLLNFYSPTGPLSGKSTVAIIIWLASWFVLSRLWRERTVQMAQVNLAAFALLAVGLLFTFPPVWGPFLG